MAALAKRTTSAAPRHRAGPSPKLVKLENRLTSLSRKARELSSDTESAVITVGVPTALGLLRANGYVLPTFGKFHPMLLWGAPLALLSDTLIGGTWGRRGRAAGVGMLACAMNDAAHTGSFKVAGDDDQEVGGDDDDD